MKKVFVLMLAVMMVFSIAAIASGFTGAQSASGNTTFVQGAEDIQSGNVGFTAYIEVYQWLNYAFTSPAATFINQPGNYTLKLANLWVSSNATLTVTYTISNPSLTIGSNIGETGNTYSASVPSWLSGQGSFNYSLGTPYNVPPVAQNNSYYNTPTSTTSMTALPLQWTGTVPYNTPAGQYTIPVNVTISTTVGF